MANSPIPGIFNAVEIRFAGVLLKFSLREMCCFARKTKKAQTTPDTSNVISYAVRKTFNFGTESGVP